MRSAPAWGASDGAVRQLLGRARCALRNRVGAFVGFEPVLRWLVGNGSGVGRRASGRFRAAVW